MNRRELREQVFMLLFRNEFHDEEAMNRQLELYEEYSEDPASEDGDHIRARDIKKIKEKCGSVLEKIPDIDARLRGNTEKWSIERIGKVELSILRLAMYEMIYDDSIPVGVAINEAVELAKKYCQDGAGAFVNGILAKFADVVEDP